MHIDHSTILAGSLLFCARQAIGVVSSPSVIDGDFEAFLNFRNSIRPLTPAYQDLQDEYYGQGAPCTTGARSRQVFCIKTYHRVQSECITDFSRLADGM